MIRTAILSACVIGAMAGESAQADAAIERGLRALAGMQAGNGHIGSDGAGVTAMAGVAFLAGGHTPTRGAYRETQMRILRAVIAAQDRQTGYLGGNGNMYGHGFAALYLAECYGLAPEEPVRRSLEAAIDLIWRAQNSEGGWRYSPAPVDADMSVTVCQIMALRAAYNAGIGGSRSVEVMNRAIQYVRNSHNGNGTFAYVLGSVGHSGEDISEVPRAAAGVMSLIGAGFSNPNDGALGPGLAFLRRQAVPHLTATHASHFWYGQYYVAQAMFHSPELSDWDRYWRAAVPARLRDHRLRA